MQTIEQCQARIKELERAIISADAVLGSAEGISILYYYNPNAGSQDPSYAVLKSVLDKE